MDQVQPALDYINSVPTSALAAVVLGLLTLYYWPIWNRHKYPPGPFPWPFLGNRLLFLKANNGGYKYFYGKFYTTLGKVL